MGRYCWWFAGKDYGWKTTEGPDWAEGFGADWVACLGQHLAGGRDSRLRRFSLHMGPKAGTNNGQPFYWTRFLAIDLDLRSGQPTGSLRDRYEACLRILDSVPLVLRSPRRGLHLYIPLAEPMSTLGLTQTFRPELPVLIPHVLESEGLEIRPAWIEVRPATGHTLRMPLASGTVQLDPGTLAPLPAASRVDEIARLVATMDHLAESNPLDALDLAARYRRASSRRSVKTATTGTPSVITPSPTSPAVPCLGNRVGEIDVDRLEEEGLYPGVTRNGAAMAIARRKMLVFGWDEDRTVDFLMSWTATSTNGFSTTAARLSSGNVAATLRNEYRRICRRISLGLATGKSLHTSGVRWVARSPRTRPRACSTRQRVLPIPPTGTECKPSCSALWASPRTETSPPSARRATRTPSSCMPSSLRR